MTTVRGLTCLAAFLAAVTALPPAAAQDAAEDSVAAAQDTAPKKKGLFGKVKAVAGNKVVKAVAKTAACTMLPGGQVIAGAIDAAGSETAGEAASGAAAAATGSSCMPGLGAAGLGGSPAGGMGGGLAGMAGTVAAGAAVPDQPMGYAPGMPTAGGGFGAPQDIEGMAACLRLSPSEYQDLVDPTRGEPRMPTKAEAKRQQQASKKMDVSRYQQCMVAGMSADEAGDE